MNLTLQGIFGYYCRKVMNTLLTADYSTPVSSAFFTSRDYLLWSGSEQEYKTRKGNIVGRLLAVFKCPINLNLNGWGFLNKLIGGQIMAVQSNDVSTSHNQDYKNYVVCSFDGKIAVSWG